MLHLVALLLSFVRHFLLLLIPGVVTLISSWRLITIYCVFAAFIFWLVELHQLLDHNIVILKIKTVIVKKHFNI